MKKMQNSYKKSGVNISLANKLVKHISSISSKDVKKTKDTILKENIGSIHIELSQEILSEIEQVHSMVPNPAP